MKKIIIVSAIQWMAIGMAMAGQPSIVKGVWKRETGEKKVNLYKVTLGRLEEIGSSLPNADGSFGFYFTPEKEGAYVIGNGNSVSAMDKYYFWFKGGEELNMAVNDSSYTLTGKNSKENMALTQWHDQLQGLEAQAVYFTRNISTYADFFPLLDKFLKTVMNKPAVATGNQSFDVLFKEWREAHLGYMATSLLLTPRSVHPSKEEIPAFYQQLTLGRFTKDGKLMDMPFGASFLGNLNILPLVLGKQSSLPSADETIAAVGNDTIRGEVFLMEAHRVKNYAAYAEMEKKYGKYLVTKDQKDRAIEVVKYITRGTLNAGKDPVNFTYPDMEGKQVSLTDFKGKVVLVDVWATWCGPCKKEIPALKKMEEEYHGKDVVFMSVSVDEQKDEQKWKDFVKKEELKGVQLFAAGWSDICKVYEIKGIPRFMVFGKDGKIVNTDAPRPSDPELKDLIDTELKK
ncbi:MAG: TlpA family protein disulfide reductase [Chitinophagaceae bacterium]|nr:TlpA family protein disulfide reductase [Chitinophagaceae bacterium]